MRSSLSRFTVFLGILGLFAAPVTAQSLTLTPDSITLQNGIISGSYQIQSTLDNTTVSTDLNLKGNTIYNLSNPTLPQEAATKAYVDNLTGANLSVVLNRGNSAGGLIIEDYGNVSDSNTNAVADVGYVQNYIDQNNADGDSDSSNELQAITVNSASIDDVINLDSGDSSAKFSSITLDDDFESDTDNQTLSQVLVYSSLANQSINLNGNQLQNVVADSPGDAVNKSYVDSVSGGTDNQGLGDVLGISNDAGSMAILNLANSTQSQAAVTYSQLEAYVSANNNDGDSSSSNEIQNLTEVLGQGNNADSKIIDNYGTPSDTNDDAVVDVGFVENYVSSNNADGDSDSTNELQNLTVSSTNTDDMIEINSGDSSAVRDSITIQDDVNAIQADLVAGNGLSGTSNNVLPGTDADVSLSLASSVAGTQLNYSSGTLSVSEGAGSGLDADTVDGIELATVGGQGLTWDSTNKEFDAQDSSATNEIQNLTQVLGQGANANGTIIEAYGNPGDSNTDAVADVGYVQNYVSGNNADADADPSNELQNLSIDSSNLNDVVEINSGDSSTVRDSVTLTDNYIGKSKTHQSGGVLDMNGFNITDSTRGNVSVNDSIKVYGNVYTSGADLAEIYSARGDPAPGSVVKVSDGKSEVEATEARFEDAVGVLSSNPGHVLNSNAEGVRVALEGKVPVRVVPGEEIEEGDEVASGRFGMAVSCDIGNVPKVSAESSRKELAEAINSLTVNQNCLKASFGTALNSSENGWVSVKVE